MCVEILFSSAVVAFVVQVRVTCSGFIIVLGIYDPIVMAQ